MIGETEQVGMAMPSNEQLLAFTKVYELGSYSVAAKEANKARTTIRELVMLLEDELNLSLFEVVGRSVKPTSEADRLYLHAKVLQDYAYRFKSIATSMLGKQEQSISIYYDAMLPSDLMLDLTLSVNKKFPHVELNWLQSTWLEAMNAIANKQADLAFFSNAKSSFSEKDVASRLLGYIELGLFCRPTSGLLQAEILDEHPFRQRVQVINHNMLNSELKRFMSFSTQQINLNNFELVCQFTTRLGWCVAPLYSAKRYVEAGQLTQVRPLFANSNLKVAMSYYFQPKIELAPVMKSILAEIEHKSKAYFC